MAKPILKWAGGKRQLLDELYQRFPASYDPSENAYHEPFLGGGALFFDHEPSCGTINDINERLYNFYIQVRDHPEALIERLDEDNGLFRAPEADPNPDFEFATTTRNGDATENFYYQLRELFNRRPTGEEFDPLDEAAQLVYLNRTCFNGLYRENPAGEFNVPIGQFANTPHWDRSEAIRDASRVLNSLSDESIRNESFEYVLEVADPGDVVYFDPPYKPMSATANFAEYSAGGFDKEDQEHLLAVATELRDKGVHVIISNSGVMCHFYETEDFYVDIRGATRYINSDGENRDEVDEIIATSVPVEDRVVHYGTLSAEVHRGAQGTLGDFS